MTTIAWDGDILAADGQITLGDYIDNLSYNKLFKLNKIYYHGDILLYVGFSGSTGRNEEYVDYLHNLSKNDFIKMENVNGIIIGNKYCYTIEDNEGVCRFNKKTKLAQGSGGKFALSAMLLGCNAVNAIKHAAKLDLYTGGKIKWIKI